ncbi:MAG: ribosome biogenesis GTP-binding protein YihA/YsxC [Chitinophagaceae bacterium]|nr:ribosome biogenesis GTP-binding protein YihA/YsxC [Chitinophagaceae bacterium]
MKITKYEFVASYTSVDQCPLSDKNEYAFIGRSNVGKSSLINMLVQDSHLAKISSTPGKTQCLNLFLINSSFYLMDMPGYGWASTSKVNKKKWKTMNETYLLDRKNLACLFVLIDSRIPPQAIDLEFIQWVGKKQIPFVLVFTKTDKLSKTAFQKNVRLFEAELHQWEYLPQMFITSAREKKGRDEILAFMEKINKDIVI